jgi:AraC-like DNA-binding protein
VQAALLLRDAEPSWAHLAAELDYVDQPHLTREFRRVAGLPPRALLRGTRPAGLGLRRPRAAPGAARCRIRPRHGPGPPDSMSQPSSLR